MRKSDCTICTVGFFVYIIFPASSLVIRKLVCKLLERILYLCLAEIVQEHVLIAACVPESLIDSLKLIKLYSDACIEHKVLIRENYRTGNGNVREAAFSEVVDNVVDVRPVCELRIVHLACLYAVLMDKTLALARERARYALRVDNKYTEASENKVVDLAVLVVDVDKDIVEYPYIIVSAELFELSRYLSLGSSALAVSLAEINAEPYYKDQCSYCRNDQQNNLCFIFHNFLLKKCIDPQIMRIIESDAASVTGHKPAIPCKRGVLIMWDKIALILLIIGGINWGLVGIFEFDMVAWLFGGSGSLLARAVYILVAISAVWCISLLFRRNEELAYSTSDR